MNDGSPQTPAEIAVAREMMSDARRELGLLVGAGVGSLALCFASASISEAVLGGGAADGEVVVEAVEQPGSDAIFILASRGGAPFAAITMTPHEALRVATQISEILNRRSAPHTKD